MWAVILSIIIGIITLIVTVKFMSKPSDFRWYKLRGVYVIASASGDDSKIGKTVTVYNRWGHKKRIILGQRLSSVGSHGQSLYDYHEIS